MYLMIVINPKLTTIEEVNRDFSYLLKKRYMRLDDKTALILEGGGLRGVFTCGVLDCFMDYGIRFPFTVGVSAGACNGLSY